MYKNYVIYNNNADNCVVVSLTENEARAIERFIDWTRNDDYEIVAVDKGDFDKWGMEY